MRTKGIVEKIENNRLIIDLTPQIRKRKIIIKNEGEKEMPYEAWEKCKNPPEVGKIVRLIW